MDIGSGDADIREMPVIERGEEADLAAIFHGLPEVRNATKQRAESMLQAGWKRDRGGAGLNA